ncbi:acyl-CoA dehydrogenase NM domain-like protein, partial [Caulochytrium protostelioides]
KRFIEIKQEHGIDQRELLLMMNALGDWLPTTLHSSMFQLLIDSQGSEEQAARWGPLADEGRMIGCYAQTELGHGSNLARLETRATYVPETDEWDLHSPSLSSAKWWIGGLGVIATHALVQAK